MRHLLTNLAHGLIRLGNWLYDQIPPLECPNTPDCSHCNYCGKCTYHGEPCVIGWKDGQPIMKEVS